MFRNFCFNSQFSMVFQRKQQKDFKNWQNFCYWIYAFHFCYTVHNNTNPQTQFLPVTQFSVITSYQSVFQSAFHLCHFALSPDSQTVITFQTKTATNLHPQTLQHLKQYIASQFTLYNQLPHHFTSSQTSSLITLQFHHSLHPIPQSHQTNNLPLHKTETSF